LWNAWWYNSYRKIYCVFIKHLVREYNIYDFTFLFKPKKWPIKLPQLLQDNEINRLLENSKITEKYIVLFFLYTWVRRFEFLALKKTDIKNNYIKIRKWKWIKERLIPIHRELQKIIYKLDYNYTEYYLDMLCRKYKKLVKNFHWHRLRHTFATNLVRNWVDIYTISQLMGHSNISTTTIYLSLDLIKKTEQINKLQFGILD
jgi:site-specific recombinase XerD